VTADSRPSEASNAAPRPELPVLQLVPAAAAAAPPITFTRENAEHILEAMPGAALLLDPDRLIVASNSLFRALVGARDTSAIAGMHAGVALTCFHAGTTPRGCAAAPQCEHCVQLAVIRHCVATQKRVVRMVTLQTRQANDGGAMEYRLHATPIRLDGAIHVVLGFEDARSERRRQALERTLFVDLRESFRAVSDAVAQLRDPGLDPATLPGRTELLSHLCQRVADQIDSQHELHLAETGSLDVESEDIALAPFVGELLAYFGRLPIAAGRSLCSCEIPELVVNSDRRILRRVLSQLLTNALEAIAEGEMVSVTCEQDALGTRISVHNPGVIPPPGQVMIFSRAYTTRPGAGRGMGLHYARMLTGYHLDGEIRFTSDEASGTTFEVTLPN
jgi:signal transduction histidine kinase